jgi:hypothetical protein
MNEKRKQFVDYHMNEELSDLKARRIAVRLAKLGAGSFSCRAR